MPENAQHIEDLLVEARRADARVTAVAAGATYAGDADPYKAPRSDEDESDQIDAR